MRECARRPAPSARTHATVRMMRFMVMDTSMSIRSSRRLELNEPVYRHPRVLRDRRREVVERLSIVVEQQRARHVALMREPVGHAGDGAIANLVVEHAIRLEVVVTQQRFPSDR